MSGYKSFAIPLYYATRHRNFKVISSSIISLSPPSWLLLFYFISSFPYLIFGGYIVTFSLPVYLCSWLRIVSYEAPYIRIQVSLLIFEFCFSSIAHLNQVYTLRFVSLVCIYVQRVYNFLYIVGHHGKISYGFIGISVSSSYLLYSNMSHTILFF